MYSLVGFDIGTTEIKCTLYLANELKYFWRESTPKAVTSIDNPEEITFSPIAILNIVRQQIEKIKLEFSPRHILISIASQAPSLCYWNDEGNAIGVSYQSYYGDSKMNSKGERQDKAIKRIQLANRLFSQYGVGKFSGITGYIVYQLSEQLTMDAVTAWELGIENFTDVEVIKSVLGIHKFPEIVAPIKQYIIKNSILENGIVIAGTTDSAILPISIIPEFSEYYVYLGTWGSLLKSQILEYKDYYKCFHQGDLHSWMISIPDFIYKVANDSLILDDMFGQIAKKVESDSKIAICGGLIFKKKDIIKELIKRHLPTQEVRLAMSDNSIIGACRLGSIVMEEKFN